MRSVARSRLDSASSRPSDLRAEELVRPHRLPAGLAIDDGDGRERSSAGTAPAEKLATALRAGVRQLGLELLEPPARRAATETECDPIAEDLSTLLPQPVRRFRHVLTLAVVAVVAVAAYIVIRDVVRGYWTTRGARIERYTLHSRFVHRDLHEIRVVPEHHAD